MQLIKSAKLSKKLQGILAAVRSLRRCRRGWRAKPHKLVLLLSVIDLYESGLLIDNRVYLNEELENRFRFYFRMVAEKGDWCQIGPPFFHLRSSGFWFHCVRPHRLVTYERMKTPGGGKGNVIANVEYAYLAQDMLDVLADDEARAVLRDEIVELLIRDTSNPAAHGLRTERYNAG